jgi:NhaP-type Na+/H+ or K+/H+ antiporter
MGSPTEFDLRRVRRKETAMLWLILLALLVIVAFGVGFAVHWLFVVAVVLALIWVIAFFAGGLRRGVR